MAAEALVRVTVVFAPAPREVREVALALPVGATVAHALAASGLLPGDGQFPGEALSVSVWGRKAVTDQVLREQDRVELCRGLQVDPKVARRLRFVKQGARSAGLFARRRPGAKAGY